MTVSLDPQAEGGPFAHPLNAFKLALEQANVDRVPRYNQCTFQNTRFTDELLPLREMRGIGATDAGPFAARLLTNAPLPDWAKDFNSGQKARAGRRPRRKQLTHP